VIVRGIALGELTFSNSRQALLKEVVVGLGNGLACGIVGGLIAWATNGNPVLGLILGMAMVINMVVAAVAGTMIPLALRALKVDPALASAVFITTLTDVFGFLSFLGLATVFLRYLTRGVEWAVPVYTSEALILRTYKLGEADRIVVFLTRDRGKKRGVAKGARRAKSRFTGALEPMTRAGVAYYEREQRDLVRINYVEPTRSPLAAATGEALGHVGYFAELIDEWAPEAHADERLYRLGASITEAVATGVPVQELARYFEYWILRLQGVYPSLTACAACGSGWSPARSCRRPSTCSCVSGCTRAGSGTALGLEAMAFLKAARLAAPERLASLALSATGRDGARNGPSPPAGPAPRQGAEVGQGAQGDAKIVCSNRW
jgi:DNA repair protein RecO